MTANAVLDESIVRVPLTQIVPSKDNRKNFDPAKLEELAASIKRDGVIVPIRLRPIKDGKFRIVYGERRYLASLIAFEGGTPEALTIPATVRDMTDEQEAEERIVENLQRDDLEPLDEAKAIAHLRGKSSNAEVALRLGKEEAYIAKRLKLLQAIPAVQERLAKGKIQLGHVLELVRLSAEDQARTLKWIQQQTNIHVGNEWVDVNVTVSLDSLRNYIQTRLLVELKSAPFDITDATLNKKMGACTTCPHNTANQAALFSDVKGARCTLPDCFFGKEQTSLERKIATMAQDRGVEKIFRLALGVSEHQNRGQYAVIADGYTRGDARSTITIVQAGKECESTIPAIVVALDIGNLGFDFDKKNPPSIGDETSVCVEAKCKVHHVTESASRPAPKKGLAKVDHKADTLTESRPLRVRNKAFRLIAEKTLKDSLDGSAVNAKFAVIAGYVARHLYGDRWRDAGKALELDKPKPTQYRGPNWQGAVKKYFGENQWALALCLAMAEELPSNGQGTKVISALADFYRVDLSEINKQIAFEDRELVKGMRERVKAAADAAPKPKKEPKAKKEKKAKAAKKAKKTEE